MSDDETKKANMSNRRKMIVDACKKIVKLEGERAEISEDIRKIKQGVIKAELSMKIADFNAALRLYQLEGDARDEFFDTLRETFTALGVGGQLDFLDAMKEDAEKAKAPA